MQTLLTEPARLTEELLTLSGWRGVYIWAHREGAEPERLPPTRRHTTRVPVLPNSGFQVEMQQNMHFQPLVTDSPLSGKPALKSHFCFRHDRFMVSGGGCLGWPVLPTALWAGANPSCLCDCRAQHGTSVTTRVTPGFDRAPYVGRFWKRRSNRMGKGVSRSHYDGKNSC